MKSKRVGALAAVISVLCGAAEAAPVCRLYEHANYQGERLRLHDDEAVSFHSGQFWNDRVSSVRVGDGCRLIVYEHTQFHGQSKRFSDDRSYVGDWWNDRISSAECRCHQRH